jgi:hypothetical protein
MSADSDREAMIARFVEHWSRTAQGHNSWRTWQPVSAPRRTVTNTGVEAPPRKPLTVHQMAQPRTTRDENVDRGRLDTAARWARAAFPGPIGELIEREISVYLCFGFRFEGSGLISRLADQVLASKLPDHASPAPTGSPGTPALDRE